jgi:DNA polymerase-3 subunit gamma/tau
MSKYVVSARKYRPSSFDTLIGQDHIARTLKNALQTDQLAHAFLFCGPRGVGKTTSARILAKVINCENPQNDKTDPCNECGSCKAFNDNASFNIIELDAASNNSVEHIRTLIEQVRFQPQQGSYKVFIIDEVHMLSSQAFNAFLKTLEEPPPYAIFILATTEKHKIIPTILSRCQIFDFKRIQVAEIITQLEAINKAENRTADVEALHLIGQKADGAMRDALSIYDKIASSSAGHISYADVVSNLNILDYDYFFKITDALLKSDMSTVLLLVNEIIRKGFEPDQLTTGLAEHLRSLLVLKDPRTSVLLDASENLKARYLNQAHIANRSFIMSGLSLLNDCDISLVRATNKRLHLEIALGKICHIAQEVSSDHFSEKKTEVNSSATSPAAVASPLAPQEPLSQKASTPLKAARADVSPSKDFVKSDNTIHPREVIDLDETTTTVQEPEEKADQESNQDAGEPIEKIDKSTPEAEAPSETEKLEDEGVLNTPSFSSFNSLISQIKTREAEKAEARKNLGIDAINTIWDEYAANNGSMSVTTAMKLAEKELERTILRVYVPTGVTRDMILNETPLLEQIRDELGVDNLSLDVRVDRVRFPEFEEPQTKKVLTNKEKYKLMVEKNPLLEDLKRKFDLKIDKE